jgi:hypothetical protein
MAKLKATWIKFLCWFKGHSMLVVAEVVDWGYWDRLSRCERCGIPFAEYNYHPPRHGAEHRWTWVA